MTTVRAGACRRCDGLGFTRWGAFLAGLGSLVGALVGEVVDPHPCKRCDGTGREPEQKSPAQQGEET